ncbi:tail fiber domain-containing protein [Candidatus Dojkabacteria bacterium]|jgi:hypothetical protein|nr:tail fiber domain-containing protein [Candidatus Dojkabacteria bacterium]
MDIIWKGKHKEEEAVSRYKPFTISHQELLDVGNISHWEIDKFVRGLQKAFPNVFPSGILFGNDVKIAWENTSGVSDAYIKENTDNRLEIKCGVIYINGEILLNGTHIKEADRIYAASLYSSESLYNRKMISLGEDGDYISIVGASNFSGDLFIAANVTFSSGAERSIRFGNNCGNTGGLVFGATNYTGYYSRIFDDGNLYLCTDDVLYFADMNTTTGAKGNVALSINMDSLASYFNGVVRFGSGLDINVSGAATFEKIGAGDIKFYQYSGGGPVQCFTIDTSNNVHVNSNSYLYVDKTDAADHTALHINTSTNRVTRATSSRRYKKNIEDYQFDLDKIDLLQAKTFNFKSDNSKGISYIAEDIVEQYPEMAIRDGEGRVENYSDKKMETLLAEEIKDLRKRVKQLETK